MNHQNTPVVPWEKLPNLTQTNERPRLYLFDKPKISTSLKTDITQLTQNVRMSMDIKIGYDSMTFDVESDDYQTVRSFFIKHIGDKIVAKRGGVKIWQGIVWEMDLTHRGVVRRISMEDVKNMVRCIFTNVDTDERADTGFQTNGPSRRIYGDIQETLHLDSVTLTTAQNFAKMYRAEHAFPRARPVSINPNKTDESSLRVTCVGYFYTLNYQYVTLADGNYTISDAITTTLTNDAEFVTAASIASNTTEVGNPSNEIKAGDWLLSLAEIGDGTDPYTLQVWNDGRLSYKKLSSNPEYVFDGHRLKSILGKDISTHKWWMRPGILRDTTWHNQPLNSTIFLQNGQDAIISQVEITEDQELPILKTTEYKDSDLYYELQNIDLFVPED